MPESSSRTSTPQRDVCVSLYTQKWCAHAFEEARGSGAWYAMKLTELLTHVARALAIDWETRPRAMPDSTAISEPLRWDEISGRETTLVDNEVYNLITTISSKLEGWPPIASTSRTGRPTIPSSGKCWQQNEQAVRRLIQQLDQCAQQDRLQS
jgi:hypothetical protein